MRAGRLRHKVTLQRSTIGASDDGSALVTWVDIGIGRVSAAIEPIRGREALTAGQIIAEMDTRIVMRYGSITAQLTERDRIVHGTTAYNIVSIAEARLAHREIEFMCKSGANSG